MGDVKQITLNQETADIKDAVARERIGDLDTLETTAKSDLVSATNEVLETVGNITDLNLPDLSDISNIVDALNDVIDVTGDKADLNTDDKSNLVAAINELEGEMGEPTELTTSYTLSPFLQGWE